MDILEEISNLLTNKNTSKIMAKNPVLWSAFTIYNKSCRKGFAVLC